MDRLELAAHYREVRARITAPSSRPLKDAAVVKPEISLDPQLEAQRKRINELLRGLPPSANDLRFSIGQILLAFNLPWFEIIGKKRARNYVMCRRSIIWLLHLRCWSTQQIGRYMERDHTTIVYHLNDVNWRRKKRPGRPPWA